MIKPIGSFSLTAEAAALPEHVSAGEHEFQQLKTVLHEQLVESLDLSSVGRLSDEQLQAVVRSLAENACSARKKTPSNIDRQRLVEELVAEVFGLGPLEPLMHDPEISDILVNDPFTIYVERRGRLELTGLTFADEAHLVRIIQRIVARLGRRIDEVSPLVDARLPDGSRVNAVVRPLALDGPALSIRRFPTRRLSVDELVAGGSLTREMAMLLQAAVAARLGIVISGGAGAGKTTLLNVLSGFVPADERIVTIEDSAELILQHPHRVRMETRPANTEGAGEITQRELVRNSLRMRPDRIVVGEVRGAEVWDMLQAMNTGHEGSLTTVHANSARDALARLEMMVAMTGFELPIAVVRQYIAAGVKLIVHVARLKGGARRVTGITEIAGADGGQFQLADIAGYKQTGIAAGQATGQFHMTGHRPAFLEQLEAAGLPLADAVWAARQSTAPTPARAPAGDAFSHYELAD